MLDGRGCPGSLPAVWCGRGARTELQAELADTLERCFADDTFSWTLGADGRWTRRTGENRSVHRELMERALAQWSAVTT